MKKRLMSLALVMLLVFGLLPFTALAASGTCGENLTWTLDSNGQLTIRGTGKMNNYYSNNAIFAQYSYNIRSIVIEPGVTGIGEYGFYHCKYITSVTIPETVKSIGNSAFSYCDGTGFNAVYYEGDLSSWCSIQFDSNTSNPLYYAHNLYVNGELVTTDLVIPDSVTSIGDYAFEGCTWLLSVTIPDSVLKLGNYSFENCRNLDTVNIPDSVTSLGNGVFFDCRSLTKVVIPDSISIIGYSVFGGCSSLTEVVLPDSITSIGDEFFSYCSNLANITIPDSVKNIGSRAFYDCRSLTNVMIPDGVKSVGESAFSQCVGLTSVSLPNGITEISSYAFTGCRSLTDINVPDSVSIIGQYAFSGCTSLNSISIPVGVSTIRNYSFADCSNLTEVVLPVNLRSINSYAFQNCSSLNSITIPDSVGSISNNAFESCTSLTDIVVPCGVGSSAFKGCTSLRSAIVKGSIGSYAFDGCTLLQQAKVSGSLSEYAFSGCTSLTRVIMESGTTIDAYALGNCPALTEVYHPATLQTVNTNAFRNSNALTDVYFAGSREQWDAMTISEIGNDPLLNANIHLNADIHSTCTHPTTVLSGAKEATCGEAGYTGDRICTVCGETVNKGRTIPALEHSWSDWVQFFPATENKNGYEVRVCGNCGKTETHVLPKLNPFTDVSADSPFHDAILWAYSHDPQITTGTSATEFSPSKACTRGQVVTFLWRAAGKPEPASTSNPFRDVSSSSSFYKAILWAAEQGITSGTSAGTFSPNETCTRGQVVTFLWRFEGKPEPSSLNNPFTDVSSGSSFFKAILWAAEQGITTGKTPTTFNPTGECTRAHVVTFLYRDMA